MKDGLVSVVIPVYNTEKYLDRCMESIVNQTYPNLEILLIDDGSPDNCPRMCDEWAQKDSRIRVIHKENAGLGMARNTGIEHATGTFVCFVDSDDYIALDTIEQACALALEDKPDLVVFGSLRVHADGITTECYVPETAKTSYSGKEVQKCFLPDVIDGRHKDAKNRNIIFSACNCLFSMELIRRTGWRFVSERKIISEDSYAILWLYRHIHRVSILRKAFYYHCENGDSLTQVYRPDRYEKLRYAYRMSRELVKELGYCEEVEKSVSALHLSLSVAAMKQVAASDLSLSEKNAALKQMLRDDAMQLALADVSGRRYGAAREILFRAMGHKRSGMCLGLLMVQNMLR